MSFEWYTECIWYTQTGVCSTAKKHLSSNGVVDSTAVSPCIRCSKRNLSREADTCRFSSKSLSVTFVHDLTTETTPDFRRVRIAEGKILEIDFRDADHVDVPDFCNIFNRKVGKDVLQRIQVYISVVYTCFTHSALFTTGKTSLSPSSHFAGRDRALGHWSLGYYAVSIPTSTIH
jgi:hypothetical protein